MKIPASTVGERFYRLQDGDPWESTREVCRTCTRPTPDGVDQCDDCVRFERENPPAAHVDAAIRRMLDRSPVDVRRDVLKIIKAVQADTYATRQRRA